MQFQTFIQNKSAWPARALTKAKLRYFFTLDSGVSPSQVAVTSSYKTCPDPAGQVPQQFSGNIYYVTIDCTGTAITPTGQQFWTRENQIRLTFANPHDFTSDWSYQGSTRRALRPPRRRRGSLCTKTVYWSGEPSPAPRPPPPTTAHAATSTPTPTPTVTPTTYADADPVAHDDADAADG